MDQANNASDSTPRLVTVGVYIAYLIGAFTGVFWLLGLITAFVYRDPAPEPPGTDRHQVADSGRRGDRGLCPPRCHPDRRRGRVGTVSGLVGLGAPRNREGSGGVRG